MDFRRTVGGNRQCCRDSAGASCRRHRRNSAAELPEIRHDTVGRVEGRKNPRASELSAAPSGAGVHH